MTAVCRCVWGRQKERRGKKKRNIWFMAVIIMLFISVAILKPFIKLGIFWIAAGIFWLSALASLFSYCCRVQKRDLCTHGIFSTNCYITTHWQSCLSDLCGLRDLPSVLFSFHIIHLSSLLSFYSCLLQVFLYVLYVISPCLPFPGLFPSISCIYEFGLVSFFHSFYI